MADAPQLQESPAPQPHRSRWRIVGLVFAGLFALVLLVIGIALWYTTTASFDTRVRNLLISTLEKDTGGRVDLGRFSLQLSNLQAEIDNLTIHGLEAPSEIPFAHIDRLVVRVKIISLFQAKVGLSYLGAAHPVVHLIVYPDGTTNQPVPKVKSSSNTSVSDEIFDLAIDRTELANGLAIVNDRKIPFNITADQLQASASYDQLRKHYLANLALNNIDLQHGNAKPVNSRLTLQADAARNDLRLSSLTFTSGDSHLQMSGRIQNFAQPQFDLKASGAIDLRTVEPLTGVAGLNRGTLHLAATGSGNMAAFTVRGRATLDDVAYATSSVHVNGLTASTNLLLTQDEISATDLRARLAEGGTLAGGLTIRNWKTTPPARPAPPVQRRPGLGNRFHHRNSRAAVAIAKATPPPAPETGTVHLSLADFSLPSVLSAIAPPKYRHLGFDTAASGTLDARWTGSVSHLTGAVDLHFAPNRTPAPGEVPVSGAIVGSYSQAAGIAQLANLQIDTPATHLRASGSLGIYPASRASQIGINLVTTNLGEFHRAITALTAKPNGKGASTAIPVDLHGPAQFHGTISGTVANPSINGHLTATNFDIAVQTPATSSGNKLQTASQPVTPGPAATHTIHVDSAKADLEYAPGIVSLENASIVAGKTTIQASGRLRAHLLRNHKYVFDDDSAIAANAAIHNASLGELLPLAGASLPVTGTLNFQARVGGTLGNLNGAGHLQIQGGDIEGDPYRSLSSDLHFAGRSLQATNLVFAQGGSRGGNITGSAAYNLTTKQFQVAAQGAGFHLESVHQLQNAKYPVTGVLAFQLNASGTEEHPQLKADLHLTQIDLDDAAKGTVDATASTSNGNLLLGVTAHLNNATLQLHDTTQISGNYSSQGKLTIAQLDLNPLTRVFQLQGVQSQSPLNATVTFSGPLKQPKALQGDVDISPLALSLETIALKSSADIRAHLHNGDLTLDPLNIEGADTHLQANGSIELFGERRPIRFHSQGAVNLKIAQSFSKQITSSGEVTFNIDAAGTTQHPALRGEVKLADVNLASQNYINGISRMNGSMVFNEGRLELRNVTAYSGGGLIQLGGFVTYVAGLYTDITANAKDVRVRYPEGVTSMVDAKARLQGGLNSLLLSGDVQITRFTVSPNIDFASLSAASGGVSLPPDPNSFANKIRMEVHITSAPSMDFQNSYAKVAGTVNLWIRGTVEEPSVLGQVTVTEGQATFAGTTYELQRGVIYFSNPIRIEPIIDMQATAQVENYSITIGLHGTTNKLTPVFRSSPPLSEQDIFSLLALGRTQEEQQIYSQEQSQAGVNSTADALLGGAINATVSSRIQKLFGGGSVKIDPTYISTTGNATARLTVEQQISKNASLTYATNVNGTADQLIQGQWNLSSDLSVLAVRDESGVFSLIFTLRKRYR